MIVFLIDEAEYLEALEAMAVAEDTQPEAVNLVERLRESIKPEQLPAFWYEAKLLNLLLLLSNLSNLERNRIIEAIDALVKLAQLAAFRNGRNVGTDEAANIFSAFDKANGKIQARREPCGTVVARCDNGKAGDNRTEGRT